MSTYGTAIVIDCPGIASAHIAPVLTSGNSDELGPGPAGEVHVDPLPSRPGWSRVSTYTGSTELLPLVRRLLGEANEGRAVVAEDNDDYGACWTVLTCTDGNVEVLHRRYILNADPDDPDEVEGALEDLEHDPRVDDVAGPDAAAAAAKAFDVDAAGMIAAEEDSESAWEEMGVIGGPFPWWDALELRWPES